MMMVILSMLKKYTLLTQIVIISLILPTAMMRGKSYSYNPYRNRHRRRYSPQSAIFPPDPTAFPAPSKSPSRQIILFSTASPSPNVLKASSLTKSPKISKSSPPAKLPKLPKSSSAKSPKVSKTSRAAKQPKVPKTSSSTKSPKVSKTISPAKVPKTSKTLPSAKSQKEPKSSLPAKLPKVPKTSSPAKPPKVSKSSSSPESDASQISLPSKPPKVPKTSSPSKPPKVPKSSSAKSPISKTSSPEKPSKVPKTSSSAYFSKTSSASASSSVTSPAIPQTLLPQSSATPQTLSTPASSTKLMSLSATVPSDSLTIQPTIDCTAFNNAINIIFDERNPTNRICDQHLKLSASLSTGLDAPGISYQWYSSDLTKLVASSNGYIINPRLHSLLHRDPSNLNWLKLRGVDINDKELMILKQWVIISNSLFSEMGTVHAHKNIFLEFQFQVKNEDGCKKSETIEISIENPYFSVQKVILYAYCA